MADIFKIHNSNITGTVESDNEIFGKKGQDSPKAEQNMSMEECAESSVGQNKVGKFQQAVRRHLGKDRLFHLVTTLLKSIEEEKKAQNDLILSFETARNIKIDIPTYANKTNDSKQRRRRKKMEISLADRIDAKRKTTSHNPDALEEGNTSTIEGEKEIEASNNGEIVGQLEFTATNTETTSGSTSAECKPHLLDDGKDSEASKNNSELTLTTSVESDIHDGQTIENSPDVNQKLTINGQKHRAFQRSALTDEKVNVVDHFRNADENFDLDKLVLDSVLENMCMGDERENEDKNVKEKDQKESNEDDLKHTDRGIYEFQQIIEVDSDGSDVELQSDIKGKTDDLESCLGLLNKNDEDINQLNSFSDKDTGNKQFERFLAEHQHVTTSQSSRMPANLIKPNLKPSPEIGCSEALYSSQYGNSSDNIIEIVTNKATLEKLNRPEPAHTKKVGTTGRKYRSNGEELGQKSRKNSVREKHTADEICNASNPSNSEPLKNQRKFVFIDLLGVYESNKDLQRINLGNSVRSDMLYSKAKTRPMIHIDNKNSLSRFKRPKCTAYCIPIPSLPKTLPEYPRTLRTLSNYTTSPSLSCARSAHSFNEHIEQFRNYAVKKDFERYRKPDNVLWSRPSVPQNKPRTSDSNHIRNQYHNYKYALAEQKHSDVSRISTRKQKTLSRHFEMLTSFKDTVGRLD